MFWSWNKYKLNGLEPPILCLEIDLRIIKAYCGQISNPNTYFLEKMEYIF